MGGCAFCTFQGQCSKTASVVGDRELANPEFRRDVRNFVATLGIRKADLLDRILELFARIDSCIVDEAGNPVSLETSIFFPSDEEIEGDEGEIVERRIENWLEETFAAPVPSRVTPRLRREARERFRIVATIMRCAFPREAMMWGVRPANDNTPL